MVRALAQATAAERRQIVSGIKTLRELLTHEDDVEKG
jgi:hypothetical protein